MSVHLYRSIEIVAGPQGFRATIYQSLSGKSARVEIWSGRRRVDTRRASPARAPVRAGELLTFWSETPDRRPDREAKARVQGNQ